MCELLRKKRGEKWGAPGPSAAGSESPAGGESCKDLPACGGGREHDVQAREETQRDREDRLMPRAEPRADRPRAPPAQRRRPTPPPHTPTPEKKMRPAMGGAARGRLQAP
ncbi:hypothetical protein CesoFtcFv8_021502 [Champsocephalus esox]|uniref:Uncharacterized protein n=1 Tax=Champsocephalus esox TaxID=159716 RepID=A0AAN8BD48_9TELE|nr:hypothetical protein CesoFtcFv8_021502 [Champsocephalus esox]